MPPKLPPLYARLRFATSLVSTWLLNANMFGFSLEKLLHLPQKSLKSVCSPGFNCHGCPIATTACPIGVMALGSAVHQIPVFAIASVLAIGAVLGRLMCAFACPFGLLQDLLHKIPSPKFHLPRFLRYGKYALLALLVFILPWLVGFEQKGYLQLAKPEVNKGEGGNISVKLAITNPGKAAVSSPQIIASFASFENKTEIFHTEKNFPDVTVAPGQTLVLPVFEIPNMLKEGDLVLDSPQSVVEQVPRYQLYFCAICPAGTLTADIPKYLMKRTTPWWNFAARHWLRLSILAIFLVLMVLISRPFCHTFCPLGAIYALTTPLSLSSMTIDRNACIGCKLCDKSCPMGLDVRTEIGGMDCIACGDCKKACPERGIRRTFGFGSSQSQQVEL